MKEVADMFKNELQTSPEAAFSKSIFYIFA